MQRILFSFLFLIQLFAAPLARAAETPIPSSPTRWVTDTAGFLSPSAVQTLDARLKDFQRQTGHQMIVWIGRTTGDTPIEDWAVKAFQKWKVGRKSLDDGLAMFIMTDDHKIRIEVGYGLEGVVPDVIANRIIDQVMAPQIRAGDRDGAVEAGVQALASQIQGKPWSAAPNSGQMQPVPYAPRQYGRPQPHPASLGQIIFGAIGLILLLILCITHPNFALFMLYVLMSGGRGGGGGGFSGGGDGGFSGGGGRSGGGGATGSW